MSIVPAKDKEGHGCLLSWSYFKWANAWYSSLSIVSKFGYLEPVSMLSTASACSGNLFNKGGEINLDMKAYMECWLPSRVSMRNVGTLSWLIIWCPLKPIFFQLFWPRTVLESLFEGACPKCRYFSDAMLCVWKHKFTSTIFLIIIVTP